MAKKKTPKKKAPAAEKQDRNEDISIGEDSSLLVEIETTPDGEDMQIPKALPILPASDVVLFPDMILPLVVRSERGMALIDKVLLDNRLFALTPMTSNEDSTPKPEDLFSYGCAGAILKMIKVPDGSIRVLVQGLKRVKLRKFVQNNPFYVANVTVQEDKLDKSMETDALTRHMREQFNKLTEMLPQFPEEIKIAAMNITHPGRLADLVCSNINLSMEERCMILEEISVKQRIEKLSLMLGREIQIAELGSKIQADVKQKIAQGQKEYFLREQLQAIRKELGEEDERFELEEIREALKKSRLPEEAHKEAERELKRLEKMQPGSAEYTVSRTYLDWMTELPWSISTEDRLDIRMARKILDDDHYNLKKVKDRIIEYLAVRKIHPEGRSPILCFAGPPGVGKTSLGQSIARAIGRKFIRVSLGGVRDEAEIRGHRRTYIGALPGRIIQGLRKAGSQNPVFMLDEIDKLVSDFHGDPSSALLEVLDPEQNHSFADHYIDAAFDLSKVIFITTANNLETIPPALRDRMEVLSIPGYSTEEKMEIATRHLIPKLLEEHGLTSGKIKIGVPALKKITEDYTREAGLRNLEREIATVIRKIAVKIASGKRGPFRVTAKDVTEYLGPQRFFAETAKRAETPGVAVGLSWSMTGGDILFIESTKMAGKQKLQLTGSLGDVIKESAQAALSWIRTHAKELAIDPNFFDTTELHIHFPEGAIPKDGPSAGVTLVASLVSLLTGRRVAPRLAMTGEISLRGKVLPVGGIKEKMLAARRAGIKDIVLPADNVNDLEELPKEVRRDLKFHPVREISEMLTFAFPEKKKRTRKKKATRR